MRQIFARWISGGFLLGSACLQPAWGSSSEGTISHVVVRQSDGLIYANILGARSSPPACATAGYFMIKDENSQAGKAQLALLMSAYFAKSPVQIVGSGTCTRWGDGEDIEIVMLKP